MKKLNTKGFGAVEVLLIIVLVGIIGGAGWFVWHSRQETNKTLDTSSNSQTPVAKTNKTTDKSVAAKDETADWLLFKSSKNTFSLRIPDGWMITEQTDSGLIYATTPNTDYKAGTKATITQVEGGRDGLVGFMLYYGDTWDASTYKKVGTFKAKDVSGTKYSITHTDDGGIGPPKGTQSNIYIFTSKGHTVGASYDIVPGAEDQTAYVEKALATLDFN